MRRTGLIVIASALVLIAGCSGAPQSRAPASLAAAVSPSPEVLPSPSPSPSPAVSPSPEPSPSPTPTPSPTPEPKSFADLVAAKHPKVTTTAVTDAIKAAFAADPVGWGNPGHTLDGFLQFFGYCVKGDPTIPGGDPYENRALDCETVIGQEFQSYQATGVEADYTAALAVYNYGYNTFSHVARFGATRDYWTAVVTLLQQSYGDEP